VEFHTTLCQAFSWTNPLIVRSPKVKKRYIARVERVDYLKYLIFFIVIAIALGIIVCLPENADSYFRKLTLTTNNKSYVIESPSFENYIKSEENATIETSINLNATNITIILNKGDVMDVHSDFKLSSAATINASLYEGSEVMITDGTNNIQYVGEMIPIFKSDNYPEGYTFQMKIPKDIKSGIYKLIILFNHTEGLTYYTPTIIVN
jgi:hypothetical protein